MSGFPESGGGGRRPGQGTGRARLPALLYSANGRRVLFTALYLSEGAPIGFFWWAMPAKLRAGGVDLTLITSLTALLLLPWVFKFLWAPLIDGVRTSRWTLRSWILTTQALMGLTLLPLAFLDPAADFRVLVPLLLLSTVAAATQDAAIDALAIATVPAPERGSVNGWMQAGMLAGRSALGGGALLLEDLLGPAAVVVLLVGVIWSSSLLVLLAPDPPRVGGGGEGVRGRLRGVFRELRRVAGEGHTWAGLLFAGVAGAGFEGLGAVAGPFLVDRGLSQQEIGTFFALHAVLGMGCGAVAGGFVADRLGARRAAGGFLLVLSAAVTALAVIDAATGGATSFVLVALMTLVYVCIGMFTASSYALFMEITDPALGATQFSAFMGATNGCESWAGLAAGRIVPAAGYPAAMAVLALVSVASLPLLRFLRRTPDAS